MRRIPRPPLASAVASPAPQKATLSVPATRPITSSSRQTPGETSAGVLELHPSSGLPHRFLFTTISLGRRQLLDSGASVRAPDHDACFESQTLLWPHSVALHVKHVQSPWWCRSTSHCGLECMRSCVQRGRDCRRRRRGSCWASWRRAERWTPRPRSARRTWSSCCGRCRCSRRRRVRGWTDLEEGRQQVAGAASSVLCFVAQNSAVPVSYLAMS